jgi:hypothetical protein
MSQINLSNVTTSLSESSSIDYNYGRISLYPSNFLSSSSVSLNFSTPSFVANIDTNLNTSFIAKKLYCGEKSHGIGEAEVIIEHNDFTGAGNNKLYLIIPVKKNENLPISDNAMNTLFSMMDDNNKGNIDFNLNINLPDSTDYYYYKTNENTHVVVFNHVIEVKDIPNSTSSYTDIYGSDVRGNISIKKSSKNAQKTDRGIVNSMSSKEDQIYIDCQPTGVSSETIASYNVPINSEYTENADLISYQRTSTTMFFFTIAAVVGYVTGPEVYKLFIINPIIKRLSNDKNYGNCGGDNVDENCNVNKNEILLGGIDTILLISFMWIFISILSVGVTHKSSLTTTSLYFVLIIISIILGIFNRRKDKEYMTHNSNNKPYTLYEWFFDAEKDIKANDYDFVNYNILGTFDFFKDVLKQPTNLIYMAILVIGLYISTFLLLDDKSGTQSLFASIIMPVVTILMTIIVLYSKKVEDEEEEDHYGLINLFRESDNNGNIFNGIANAFNGVANAVKGLF